MEWGLARIVDTIKQKVKVSQCGVGMFSRE